MKNLMGWITDPYVHVFLIGLVLVRLAMAAGHDEPVSTRPGVEFCERCREFHDGWHGSCNLDQLADLLQGR